MFMGIDIGKTGAVAFLTSEKGTYLEVHDMPVVDDVTSAIGLARLFASNNGPGLVAYVEYAQAMPGQGTVSMFHYGRSFGVVLGVLAAYQIPFELVRPSKWKKFMGLTGQDKKRLKERARALAQQWYPEAPLDLKKHHGRAEALLIARYGWRQLHPGMAKH